ncbi:hypothetical protein [Streptomyces sp. NPDC057580]|uniref:hypothetical protein n=1 Tax=unclassified Streptomyces TaxID=2593676 RepID=UPI0036BB023C
MNVALADNLIHAFGVVPMPTNKKMPIYKGWPDLAMTSAEEVETYWRSFTP